MFDAIIIGGGVIGAMCARELTRYRVKVAVAEAADDVCAGASRANSGIVHAGFDAPYGSLKAKFNIAGNRVMPKVCEELGVRYQNNGSLVVAHGPEEEQKLRELLERGLKNGVTGLEILDKTVLAKMEPNLADDVTSALYAPNCLSLSADHCRNRQRDGQRRGTFYVVFCLCGAKNTNRLEDLIERRQGTGSKNHRKLRRLWGGGHCPPVRRRFV